MSKKESTPLKEVLNKVLPKKEEKKVEKVTLAKNSQGVVIDCSMNKWGLFNPVTKDFVAKEHTMAAWDVEAGQPEDGWFPAYLGTDVVGSLDSIFKTQSSNQLYRQIGEYAANKKMASSIDIQEKEYSVVGSNGVARKETKMCFEGFASFDSTEPEWIAHIKGKDYEETKALIKEARLMVTQYTGQVEDAPDTMGIAESRPFYVLKQHDKGIDVRKFEYCYHPIAGMRTASWVGIDSEWVSPAEALIATNNELSAVVKIKGGKYVVDSTKNNKRIPVPAATSTTHPLAKDLDATFVASRKTNIITKKNGKTIPVRTQAFEMKLEEPMVRYFKDKKGEVVTKEQESFFAALAPDAISMPSLIGYMIVNANIDFEKAKTDASTLKALLGFEAVENIDGLLEQWEEGKKKFSALEWNEELMDILEKFGAIQTDGLIIISDTFANYLAMPVNGVRYAPETGNFQSRLTLGEFMANNKGLVVKNKFLCKKFNADMILHDSVIKTRKEDLNDGDKTSFTLSVMNHAKDNKEESFRPIPSSAVSLLGLKVNTMKEFGKGAVEHITEKNNEFVHGALSEGAQKEFLETLASTEVDPDEQNGEDQEEINIEDLFGAAKNIAACPQLIGEQYHRQDFVKQLIKSIQSIDEGYIYAKGVRPYYMVGDLVAYFNALENGHVVVDDNGMLQAVLIQDSDVELAPHEIVCPRNKVGKVGKALLVRCPVASESEIPVVEMVNKGTAAKWMKSGELKGCMMFSAAGLIPESMSGADYDGDTDFLIEIEKIVAEFEAKKKRLNIKPMINKHYFRKDGKLIVKSGAPSPQTPNNAVTNLTNEVARGLGIKAEGFTVIRTGRNIDCEFSQELYNSDYELCNRVYAYSLKYCVTYNMKRSEMGSITNTIYGMTELESYYRFIAAKPQHLLKGDYEFEHIRGVLGATVHASEEEISIRATKAANRVRRMRNVATFNAWCEIDAPKHGGAYKEYTPQYTELFKPVPMYEAKQEAKEAGLMFEEWVIAKKGVFAPLFFPAQGSKIKNKTTVSCLKPRWLANQKLSATFCHLAPFSKNSVRTEMDSNGNPITTKEYVSVTPMEAYCEAMATELKGVWEQFNVGERYQSVADSVIFALDMNKKSPEFKMYMNIADGLKLEVNKLMEAKQEAINVIVNRAAFGLARHRNTDIQSVHLRYRRDVLMAKLRKAYPKKLRKIETKYKEKLGATIEATLDKCVENGIEASEAKLFAALLESTKLANRKKGAVAKAAETGFFNGVSLPWFLFADAAFEVISSEKFKSHLTFEKMDSRINKTKTVATSQSFASFSFGGQLIKEEVNNKKDSKKEAIVESKPEVKSVSQLVIETPATPETNAPKAPEVKPMFGAEMLGKVKAPVFSDEAKDTGVEKDGCDLAATGLGKFMI